MHATFGILGLGVMGRNLALNFESKGIPVAVWNRDPGRTERFIRENQGKLLTGAKTLEELVRALEPPRRILLMIRSGRPVDEVLQKLNRMLDRGDIVLDGGNSWFKDTQRRQESCRNRGVHFFGMGVSGGAEGARHGPSLMPGGPPEAYPRIRGVLERIAAKTDSGPCVTYVGPGGAGHFVKMVHNGIEYGFMQLLAEAYDLLHRGLGLEGAELGDVFEKWNQGDLGSFLVGITAKILRVRDASTGAPLVEKVLDQAGQKGTGRWTVQVALDLGVPVPTITAGVEARLLSSLKAERARASATLSGPPAGLDEEAETFTTALHEALFGSLVCTYAQGMNLIRAASAEYGWGIRLREIAKIWKGGCIIRARLLDDLLTAYDRDPDLANLLLDPSLAKRVQAVQTSWRRVTAAAHRAGIPIPALAASLAYFDAYRTARLPQNLTQAQRDAFGAHTYLRVDDPDGGPLHTDWLGPRDPDAGARKGRPAGGTAP